MTTERPRRNDLLLFVSTGGIVDEGLLRELATNPSVLKYADGWHLPNSTMAQLGIRGVVHALERNNPETSHQHLILSLDGHVSASEQDGFEGTIDIIAHGLEPRAILLSIGQYWQERATRIGSDLAESMRSNAPRLHTRSSDGRDPQYFKAFDGSVPESVTTGLWPDILPEPERVGRSGSSFDSDDGPTLLSKIVERRVNGDTRMLVLHPLVLIGRSRDEIESILRHCRMQVDEAPALLPSARR